MATKDEKGQFITELEALEKDTQDLRDQWDDYWDKWELKRPDPSENPMISQFQTPYPFSHVETILPRIVGVDPTISYVAIDNDEDDAPAQMLTAVVNWQMQQMGFEHEVRNFIRQGLITGYSVAKVGWNRQVEKTTAEVIREVWSDELLQTVETSAEEEIEMVVRNQAFFETVDVYDFLWPLRATSIDKAHAVWQRRWVTMEYLEEMARQGIYKNVSKVSPGATGDRQTVFNRRMNAQGIAPQEVIIDNDQHDMVELWERWEDDRLWVVAQRDVELRDRSNPFHHQRKPFVDYCPVERPFSMHGVGIIKVIWDQNEDLSALKRQRRDAVTYLLNPMWKGTEGIDEDEITLAPGGFLRVPDTDDIQPMTEPSIDFAASYQEEAQAKEDMQVVTGAYDYFSGVNPGGQQTATGVATITNEANKRIAEMIKVFSERTMKRLGAQMASLCIQYLDEAVAVPLTQWPEAQAIWEQLNQTAAPRLVRVGQRDIETAGRVLPLPEVGQDKQLNDVQKRSDAVQTMQAVGPLLASPMPVINPKELADWMLKQFGVSTLDRAKILDTSQMPMMPVSPNTSDGGSNTPTGAVVGQPGVSGPAGPAGQAVSQ